MGKSRANRRKSDPAKTRRNSHLHKMRHSPRRPGRMVGKSQAREHQKRIERKPPTSANRLRGSIPVPRPRPSNADRGILEGNAAPHRPRPSSMRGAVKPSHESDRENSQSRTRDLHPKQYNPLQRRTEREILSFCLKHEIGVLGWGPSPKESWPTISILTS